MGATELIALAASTSLLAGWRLYLVTPVTGLAMRFGWIALPEHLQAHDILTNNWVLAAAAFGTFAEFFADKIAWVDSAWDAIHSFIRPLGGALLSLAIVDAADPAWQVGSFLLGGGAAFLAHAGKAGARTIVNTSPEPFSNVIVSTIPHVRADCYAMYTNNPPSGAFRGFGVTQSAFAVESMMDMLAEKLGVEPVELRRINALHVGSITNTGQELRESVGLMECIDKVSSAICQVSGLAHDELFKPHVIPDTPHLVRSWGFCGGIQEHGSWRRRP